MNRLLILSHRQKMKFNLKLLISDEWTSYQWKRTIAIWIKLIVMDKSIKSVLLKYYSLRRSGFGYLNSFRNEFIIPEVINLFLIITLGYFPIFHIFCFFKNSISPELHWKEFMFWSNYCSVFPILHSPNSPNFLYNSLNNIIILEVSASVPSYNIGPIVFRILSRWNDCNLRPRQKGKKENHTRGVFYFIHVPAPVDIPVYVHRTRAYCRGPLAPADSIQPFNFHPGRFTKIGAEEIAENIEIICLIDELTTSGNRGTLHSLDRKELTVHGSSQLISRNLPGEGSIPWD